MNDSKENFYNLLKNNPDLAKNLRVEISGTDYIGMVDYSAQRIKESEPKRSDPEEYLTPEEMSKTLKVSLVTLWSWDKKGITIPLRIGNKKLYRRSDLEKILQNA
jgi:hypothetical protein